MKKILIIITIVINFSICGFAQERYIKSEVLDFIKKEIKTNEYLDVLNPIQSIEKKPNFVSNSENNNGLNIMLKVGAFFPIFEPYYDNYNTGFGFSTGVMYDFTNVYSFSAEFKYHFVNQRTFIFDTIKLKSFSTIEPNHFYSISLNSRFYVIKKPVKLFLGFGIGILRYKYLHEDESFVEDYKWEIDLSAGVVHSFNKSMALEISLKFFDVFPSYLIIPNYITLMAGINFNLLNSIK
jgi:hypothetical protein